MNFIYLKVKTSLHRRDRVMKKRYLKMIIIILILIMIDQAAKGIIVNNDIEILSNIKIECIQNFGGAYGIGGDSTVFFILVNIVVLGIIIKFICSQKDRVDRKTLFSLILILAGGFSNLIDRIVWGYVVDYIDITNYFEFPVFNIADIYIVMGWIMLFICIIIYWYKEVRVTCK